MSKEKKTLIIYQKNNVSIDKDAIASPPDNSLNKVELDTLKNTTINLPLIVRLVQARLIHLKRLKMHLAYILPLW